MAFRRLGLPSTPLPLPVAPKSVQRFVWLLLIALVVLHQDNWFWTNGYLVFGFFPIGLFYHALLSLAAGATWYLATRFCWPAELDDAAPSPTGGDR